MNADSAHDSAATHDLSFVVPAYNEEETLAELVDRIRANVPEGLSYEILLVDDGSTDGTAAVIAGLCARHPEVRGIQLLTRSGKGVALDAGFRAAGGVYIFTLDADLQNDPADIPQFLDAMTEEGYDLLTGWRQERHDRAEKRIVSRVSNWWMRKVVGVPLHDINCGFKCFRDVVAKSLPLYGELHRQIPMFAYHRGFTRIGEIPVMHHPRRTGRSKYGVERYWRATFDMITALFLIQFGRRPLHFFGGLGLPCLVLGLLATLPGLVTLRPGVGFPLGLGLILVGSVFLSAGLLGELLVYLHAGRDRPLVREIRPEDE